MKVKDEIQTNKVQYLGQMTFVNHNHSCSTFCCDFVMWIAIKIKDMVFQIHSKIWIFNKKVHNGWDNPTQSKCSCCCCCCCCCCCKPVLSIIDFVLLFNYISISFSPSIFSISVLHTILGLYYMGHYCYFSNSKPPRLILKSTRRRQECTILVEKYIV